MSSTPIAELVVGIVGRAHGLRGEVAITVRTDSPDERFAVGAELRTRREGEPDGRLTVLATRRHGGRWLVIFDDVADRDTAERLRGTQLWISAAELPPTGDPDTFHDHELEGLSAVLLDGTAVGTVRAIAHGPGGDLLVIARDGLPDGLVPFVRAIVPTVDTAAGRIVLTPPEGLLDG